MKKWEEHNENIIKLIKEQSKNANTFPKLLSLIGGDNATIYIKNKKNNVEEIRITNSILRSICFKNKIKLNEHIKYEEFCNYHDILNDEIFLFKIKEQLNTIKNLKEKYKIKYFIFKTLGLTKENNNYEN